MSSRSAADDERTQHALSTSSAGAGGDEGLEPGRRPRILLFTDRVPGNDTGYGMRVSNVIAGLQQVGDLHVCLIDSSTGGEVLPTDGGYATTLVRAKNPKKWRKLLLVVLAIASLPYQSARVVRADITRTVGQHRWDLVWCSRARSHRITCADVAGARIVDFDDLTDRLLHSEIRDRVGRHGRARTIAHNTASWLGARRWRRLQSRIAREVERVVVCSEADRAHLGVTNAAIVPNGYRRPTSEPSVGWDPPPTLFFVGPLSYEPNILAVEWMAGEVLPLIRRTRPDVRLVVAGYDDGSGERVSGIDGVTLLGYVDDVAPHYADAAVAVTPLHSGGGTRLKVIEAMARCVPLVSTSFGCEGFGLVHGHQLLIADDPAGFAAACLSIIEDPALAARLAAAANEHFEQHLTADASAAAVARLAAEVIESSGGATSTRTSSSRTTWRRSIRST